jgi:NF-kappa-B inhibitor-like protein 2
MLVGEFGKAIDEHKAELQLSTLLNLPTDRGIAHRKIGECLCELGQFKEALQHQQRHLQVAKSTGDIQEQQRAYATIGRTWFVWSQENVHQTEETQTRLNSAEKAYLMSQEKCNELEGIVSNKEWLTMKGRLFLNLGLVHESQTNKRNSRKAKKFLECALRLSRENGDYETEYRSQLSLASSFMHDNMTSYALRCYELAIKIAKQQKSTKLESEVHEGMGQAFVVIGNLKAAKQHLSKSFKLGLSSPMEQHMLGVNLKRVRKAVRLEKLLNLSSQNANKEEEMKNWEKLGDLCAKLRTYGKAVSCYEKQLSISHELGWRGDRIAPVLFSLATTLADNQMYNQAIQYYKMEIEAREGTPLEQCSSWCCIARAHTDAGHSPDDVIAAYLAALKCAEDANSLNQQCIITKRLLKIYDKEGNMVKVEELQEELRNLEIKCQTVVEWKLDTGETSDITDNNSSEDEESGDVNWTSDDSDSSDEETPGRRSKRSGVLKTDKVNAKGETLLHQNCISGNLGKVRSLLAEGATVHTRDYCGWTPLHEACNHGYTGKSALEYFPLLFL